MWLVERNHNSLLEEELSINREKMQREKDMAAGGSEQRERERETEKKSRKENENERNRVARFKRLQRVMAQVLYGAWYSRVHRLRGSWG